MAHEQAFEELMALFSYNLPSTRMPEESNITFSYPNMFYDRHLDHSTSSLKHIKGTPSLSLDIAHLVFDELKSLKGRGQLLPPIYTGGKRSSSSLRVGGRATFAPRTTIRDATSVAQFYHNVSYENCSPVASTIALHPHAGTWLTVLNLCDGSDPERNHPPAMVDDYVLKIYHRQVTGELTIPEEILSCLHDELLRDIRAMSSRVFQFHAPVTAVKELFEDMGVWQ
ncbi:hypothetical protein APHAL10511_000665 [Amanita phalloides]|nr:hypothetical protein APHAL10511_000665 [Amanita phalloides]